MFQDTLLKKKGPGAINRTWHKTLCSLVIDEDVSPPKYVIEYGENASKRFDIEASTEVTTMPAEVNAGVANIFRLTGTCNAAAAAAAVATVGARSHSLANLLARPSLEQSYRTARVSSSAPRMVAPPPNGSTLWSSCSRRRRQSTITVRCTTSRVIPSRPARLLACSPARLLARVLSHSSSWVVPRCRVANINTPPWPPYHLGFIDKRISGIVPRYHRRLFVSTDKDLTWFIPPFNSNEAEVSARHAAAIDISSSSLSPSSSSPPLPPPPPSLSWPTRYILCHGDHATTHHPLSSHHLTT